MNANLESLSVPTDATNSGNESSQPKVENKSHAQVNSAIADVNSINVNSYVISGSCGFTSSVDVKINGVSFGTALCSSGVTADNGTWSASVNLASVSDGNIAISLNDAGSAKLFDSKNVIKDVIPPAAALASPPASVNNLSSIASSVINTDTYQYSYKIGSASTVDCANAAGYSAFQSSSSSMSENLSALPDGNYKMCVVAKDRSGNIQSYSSATVYTWTKDTSVPTVVLTNTPAVLTKLNTTNITVGGAGVVQYKYKYGLSNIDCAVDTSYSTDINISSSIALTLGLGDGTYKLCVVGKNNAGTWQSLNSATTYSWVIDQTAPSVSITSPASNTYSNSSSISVNSNCSENGVAVTFKIVDSASNQVTSSSVCSAGSASASLNVSSLVEGSLTISSSQTDGAGNTGSSNSLSIVRDVTGPTLSSITDGVFKVSTTDSPSVSWTAATDALSGVSQYQIALGTSNISQDVVSWTNIGNVLNYQFAGLGLVVNQNYFVHLRAIDVAGNVGASIVSDGWKVLAPLSLANKSLITGESLTIQATGGGGTYSYSGSSYLTTAGVYTAPLGVAPFSETVTVTDNYNLSQTAQVKVRAFEIKDSYNYNTTTIASDSQLNSIAQDSLGYLYVTGDGYDASSSAQMVTRKSSDSGATWTTIDTFVVSGAINTYAKSIYIDNSDNIYVVGSYGMGSGGGGIIVRKSSNRGVSWSTFTVYSSNVVGSSAAAYGIDKAPNGDLYVSGNLTVLDSAVWSVFKSTDGGLNWSLLTSYSYPSAKRSTAYSVVTTSATTIYVAGSISDTNFVSHWVVQKSTDAGATWTLADDFLYSAGKSAEAFKIVKNTAGDLFVAGYGSDASYVQNWIIRKSSDGGATWSNFDVYVYSASRASFAQGIVIDSSNNIYAVGTGSDSSYVGHWLVRKYASAGGASIVMNYNAVSGIAATGTSIFISSTGDLYSGGFAAFSSTNPGNANHWLLRKSTNAGSTWSNVDDFYISKGISGSGKGIVESANVLYSAGSANDASFAHWIVRTSSDVGVSWNTSDDYVYPSGKATAANVVGKDAAGNIYAAGYGSDTTGVKHWIVRKLSPGSPGSSWGTVSDYILATGKSAEATSIAFSAGAIYVAGSALDSSNYTHWIVRKSTDGGSTWSTVDNYNLVTAKISIAYGIGVVGSGSAAGVYVVGAAVDSSNVNRWIVRKSTDGGATWSTVDNYNFVSGKDSYARTIAVDSNANIYVSGYASDASFNTKWIVKKSTDGGATWTVVDTFSEASNLSAGAYSLMIDSNDKIYVAGYASESNYKQRLTVRVSANGGSTWSTVDRFNSNSVASYGYAIAPCFSNKVCIAGQGSSSGFMNSAILTRILSDQ